MGFLDFVNSLADRLHLGSEGEPGDMAGYDEGDYHDEGYAPEEGPWQEEAQEVASYYETGYGTGSSYVKAGARPRQAPPRVAKPSRGARGFLSRIRGDTESYDEPEYADNVVPMRSQHSAREEEASPYQPRRAGVGIRPQDIPGFGEEESPVPRRASETMIYLVRRKPDAEEIISYMMAGGNIIVNMEEVDASIQQRVIDMIGGAAFALGATVERISYSNYLVVPSGETIIHNVSLSREAEPEEGTPHRGFRARRP